MVDCLFIWKEEGELTCAMVTCCSRIMLLSSVEDEESKWKSSESLLSFGIKRGNLIFFLFETSLSSLTGGRSEGY